MRIRPAFLTLLAIALAAHAYAEPLTLEHALSAALERHYGLLGVREDVHRLEGQITEARSQVLPQLALEALAVDGYDASLRDFGVDPDALRERFAFYTDRFPVEIGR